MYILDGTTIRRPYTMKVTSSTQVAQNRTIGGSITRDYFGDSKRTWTLAYRNVNINDFNTIQTIYLDYLDTAVVKSWEITEDNYPVSETNVHIDLIERQFAVRGEDYLSDFDLVLTEA